MKNPFDLWNEIVKIAIIGTDRAKLDTAILQQLQAFNIDENLPSNLQLMEAATNLSLMKKAGYPLPKWETPLPSRSEQAESYLDKKLLHYLERLIHGSYRKVLPEFIDLVKDQNKAIPPRFLPPLLNQAVTSPDFWQAIQPIIGDRGYWLINLNPAWKSLRTQLSPEDLNTQLSEATNLVNLIQPLKVIQPQRAIQLLENEWQNFSKQEKKAFLDIFRENQHPEDEAFLTNCLNDNHKDIRIYAAQLLAALPDNQFLKDIYEILEETGAIRYRERSMKKPKISFENLDQLTEKLKDKHINLSDKSTPIQTIRQLIALIPPSHWEEKFQHEPRATLDLFVRSEWGEQILPALIGSTKLHENQDWSCTMIDFWLGNFYKQRWEKLNPQELIPLLTTSGFNDLAFEAITQIGNLTDEKSPVTILLSQSQHIWFDKVTLSLFDNFVGWTNNNAGRFWSGWLYKRFIKKAAYLANPNLVEQLSNRFTYYPDGFESELNQFFNTLQFRKELIEAFRE